MSPLCDLPRLLPVAQIKIAMKTFLIILVIAAVAGWAVWYQFIRQKSLGEKIDDASRKVEKSVNDAVKKVTP